MLELECELDLFSPEICPLNLCEFAVVLSQITTIKI
jgi:hypothetical protein